MIKDNSNQNQESNKFKFLPTDYKTLFIRLGAALIIGLIGTVIYQGKKMVQLEEKINATKEVVKNNSSDEVIKENKKEVLEKAVAEVQNPSEQLIELIKFYQSRYVKKSTGSYDYQAFTETDLKKFYDRKIPNEIKERLSTDGEFLGLVLAIKQMPPQEWGKLKNKAFNTYKPTYGEVGGAKSDGSAQTEVGQEAERKICDTIVDLVSNLKKKDKSEIIEMID